MSTEVRWRRGSTAEHASFVGAISEITVDTDKNVVVVHDGVTAGGHPGVSADSLDATYAKLLSPTFTGTPAAPTPAVGDNSGTLATTKFVKDQSYTSTISPAFTGVPTAPTASPGTTTTQLATTAFVSTAISSLGNQGVRQTVTDGLTSIAGYANMLSAGTGLSVNLSAATVAMRTMFAQGQIDFNSTLSSNTAGVVTGLTPNAVSYISQEYLSPSSVTWGSTLAPRQEGMTYVQSAQSVLNFTGTAGATTFLDDFGNTWLANAGAKVQSNQVKFGTTALGGGGAANAMNGSSDYVKSNSFTSFGAGSWTMRVWAYLTTMAVQNGLFSLTNAGGFGAGINTNTSGKLALLLSSNGIAYDIANGTGTGTVLTNTWNCFELTFDAVAGKYFTYLNGVMDSSTTSSLRICPTTLGLVGSNALSYFANGYMAAFEFLPYCQHPNGTTHTPATVAPSVAVQGYASDWFDVATMTWKQVLGPSTVAGTNPFFTVKNRIHVAEALTGATTVTSVTNYALRGYYDSGLFSVVPLTAYTKNHNLGFQNNSMEVHFVDDNLGTNERLLPGVAWIPSNNYGYAPATSTRTSSAVRTFNGVGMLVDGTPITVGYYRIISKRTF